jgi:hypothetical protein
MNRIDWSKVAEYLGALYSASDGLEEVFPGRKFTLDGHLVGSVGEVIAAYMFNLSLNPASTKGHDAKTFDGRSVEVKLTQGKAVAIRHEPEYLIVLHRPKLGPVRVVYNGPGDRPWKASGTMQSNGQRRIALSKLAILDEA